jgi:hypothetical protein
VQLPTWVQCHFLNLYCVLKGLEHLAQFIDPIWDAFGGVVLNEAAQTLVPVALDRPAPLRAGLIIPT